MKGMNHNVLLCTDVVDDKSIRALSKYSKVYKLADLTEDRLNEVLPLIDCLLVFSWPSQVTNERLQKMTSLRFIQSILAGVNHIPFASLNKSVIVSSNAGAYSEEVAEYALALLLSAAKRVVELHVSLRDQKWTLKRTLDEGSEITMLREKVLGILGFGGIGSAVGRIAKGFGMLIYAYSRKKSAAKGVKFFAGPSGLASLLKKSDGVVLALPLTSQTARIVNAERLSEMKKDGILVNVARGELLDDRLSLSLVAEFHRDATCLGAVRPRDGQAGSAGSEEHNPISERAPPSQHCKPGRVQNKLPILATGQNEQLREQSV